MTARCDRFGSGQNSVQKDSKGMVDMTKDIRETLVNAWQLGGVLERLSSEDQEEWYYFAVNTGYATENRTSNDEILMCLKQSITRVVERLEIKESCLQGDMGYSDTDLDEVVALGEPTQLARDVSYDMHFIARGKETPVRAGMGVSFIDAVKRMQSDAPLNQIYIGLLNWNGCAPQMRDLYLHRADDLLRESLK